MYLNRPALKAEARACMSASGAKTYLTALVYVLLSLAMTELLSRLLFPTDQIYYVIDFENRSVGLHIEPEYYTRVLTEPLAYVIALLLELALAILDAGVAVFCLRVARREESSVWNLLDGFAQPWRVLGLVLLRGALIFLWSLLFVVPGIVAAYRYRLALYLLLENPQLGVTACLRESKRLMTGRKGELFVLDLSLLGWYLLSAIPFAAVYTLPYMQTTFACYYLAVTENDRRPDEGGRFGRVCGREQDRQRRRDDEREPWEY